MTSAVSDQRGSSPPVMGPEPMAGTRSGGPMSPPGMGPEVMAGIAEQLSRVLGDVAGAMASLMCALGNRLGLIQELAAAGACTSAELAARAGLEERYVREWLRCMASAGYLEVDRASERFSLPPALAMVLGAPGSPFNLAAGYELIPPLVAAMPLVADAFRRGGGVAQEHYPEALYVAMEAMSATWLDTMLVGQWIPAVGGLAHRLGRGGRVADVGCGGGRALILLAQAFPESRFVGYDAFAPNVARATAAAAEAGVGDIVAFEQAEAAEALEGSFDLVTAFDVLHDAPDVAALLRRVRACLGPEGVLLILESHSAPDAADNRGPAATILYATSVLYCVPSTLAGGGEGLGTLGLAAEAIRDRCGQAGFRSVRHVPTMGAFNALYEARP